MAPMAPAPLSQRVDGAHPAGRAERNLNEEHFSHKLQWGENLGCTPASLCPPGPGALILLFTAGRIKKPLAATQGGLLNLG